jgi:hypothetical protein
MRNLKRPVQCDVAASWRLFASYGLDDNLTPGDEHAEAMLQ